MTKEGEGTGRPDDPGDDDPRDDDPGDRVHVPIAALGMAQGSEMRGRPDDPGERVRVPSGQLRQRAPRGVIRRPERSVRPERI